MWEIKEMPVGATGVSDISGLRLVLAASQGNNEGFSDLMLTSGIDLSMFNSDSNNGQLIINTLKGWASDATSVESTEEDRIKYYKITKNIGQLAPERISDGLRKQLLGVMISGGREPEPGRQLSGVTSQNVSNMVALLR